MSERTVKIVVGVVLVLVLAYVGVGLASLGGGKPEGELAEKLDELDLPAIQGATLVSAGDTIALRRHDGDWTVNGYAADSAMAAGFISALKDGKVGRVASTNPVNHDRLGVSTDSAVTLELEGRDGPLLTLLVGKQGSGYNTVYVRLPGQDEVRLLNAPIGTARDRDVDGWRDHVIVKVDTGSVARIEVTRGDTGYTLARGDSAWTVDGAPAQARPVRNLLGSMAAFRADAFAPDSTRTGGAPARRLIALDAAGDTLADLAFFTGGADSRLRVTTAGGGTVFEVASWQADRIVPAADALRGAQHE